LLVGALVVAGCGSKTKTTTTTNSAGQTVTTTVKVVHFAKTKFLLHAGLAFGTFHRWIYKPLKRGDFKDPLHHKGEIVKAGLAAAFVVHEIKLASEAAQGSPALMKLFSPLVALKDKLSGLVTKLKGGKVDSSDVASLQSANTDISSISSMSSGLGAAIKEKAAPAF
jgi:hypothetical protein